MLKESENFEQEISKKLYADFSEFRLKLFENAVSLNLQISQTTILSLTQKLCDRIIFVLFAEDMGLLKSNLELVMQSSLKIHLEIDLALQIILSKE